jgi:hypothetical protein
LCRASTKIGKTKTDLQHFECSCLVTTGNLGHSLSLHHPGPIAGQFLIRFGPQQLRSTATDRNATASSEMSGRSFASFTVRPTTILSPASNAPHRPRANCTDGSGNGSMVCVLRDIESHSLVLNGLVRPALVGHRTPGLDPGGTAQARSTLEDGASSLASVGNVMALGCTVVSTVTRLRSLVRSAPL